MSDSDIQGRQPRKRSIVRILLYILAALIVLLVAAYLVVGSSAFVQSVVLPRVGESLDATVTAADVDFAPFSHVIFNDLRVQTTPQEGEPLLTAKRMQVDYDLLAILGGTTKLKNLILESPVVHIRQRPDGSSNLDPLLEEDEPSGEDDPPSQLSIDNFEIKNGTIRFVQIGADSRQMTELTQVNFKATDIANSKSGQLQWTGSVRVQDFDSLANGAARSTLAGELNGGFSFGLDAELLPNRIQGNTRLDIQQGSGDVAELAGLSAIVETEITPTEIKQLALRFSRNGQSLGQASASGPFDLNKAEGELQVTLDSIDRQALNLFAAGQGWDFQNTQISSTNRIRVANSGTEIQAAGRLRGANASMRQDQTETPPVDLSIDYQVELNLNQEIAVVRRLNVDAQQNQKNLIRASIDQPMSLSWGQTAAGLPDSTFHLAVNQLDLGAWQPVFGPTLQSGRVDLQLELRSQQNGKQLLVNLNSQVQDLTALTGTNSIQQANVAFVATGEVVEFQRYNIDPYEFRLQHRDRPAVLARGSIRGDRLKNEMTAIATAEIELPVATQMLPLGEITATNGTVLVQSTVSQNGGDQTINGSLSLTNFTGSIAGTPLSQFNSAVSYHLAAKEDLISIQQLNAALSRGTQPAGTIAITGSYHLSNQIAQVTFQTTNLNEKFLAPFLAPTLGEARLVSLSISGNGNANYHPTGESAVKAALNLSNLVVAQPKAPGPTGPLSAALQIDGSLQNQLLELRQFLVALTPTSRAKNELQIQGRIDLAETNPAPSQLTVRAEALDVTSYYDIFSGGTDTNTPAETAQAPAPAAPPQEPDPIDLPVQQLTADANIGRFYLREIAVTNLQLNAKIDAGQVSIEPLQLNLNGGPIAVSGAVDVSVPGYKYALAVQADRVPIEPIANSLMSESAGRYKGELLVNGRVNGAGTTGASLQKSLDGQLMMTITNMNLDIVGPKIRRLLEPIALALRLPELTQTPLHWIHAETLMAQGTITLTNFSTLSQAFVAQGQGTIRIADVLTNSTLQIPLTISLRRSLAEKARLIPQNAPTNTPYVTLPSFATITGTLGNPKTDVNEVALAGLLLRTAGNIPQIDEKAGNILQGLGNILSGQRPPAGTNDTQTTNPPPKLNPLDLFKLLPKKEQRDDNQR